MKILVIDSHKGTDQPAQNLHWLNANRIQLKLLSDGHEVDFIWSHPTVNDNVKGGYDSIIFVHASRYMYVSDEWISKSPNAKLFYITNEYNLGEPLVLWSTVKKTGRKYDVIANHEASISKVVGKYVENWNILNLNSLITEPKSKSVEYEFFTYPRDKCVYYGSFRKNRAKYFSKYFNSDIVISTHAKNKERFGEIGISGPFVDRIDWAGEGLSFFRTSLYIEDEKTHKNYNFLANRFYEAINYDVFPLFDKSCLNTIKLSGYEIPDYAMVDKVGDVDYITKKLPWSAINYICDWRTKALAEKNDVLTQISKLVT